VRSYDWLRPCGGIRLAQGVKERTIDEQRMAVLAAARGPNDRRVRLALPIDNSSNGCRGQQRHIHERHQDRDDTRAIDHAKTCEKRR